MPISVTPPAARRRAHLLVAALLAVGAPLLVPAAPARAASFAVTTSADTPDANPGNGSCADATGACSLRAAIEETNALAGMDSVTLPANTYTLADQLVVEDSLFLNGAGRASTIIDGNASTELLKVRTVELLVCDSGNDSVASYDRNGQRNVDFLSAGAGGMSVPGAIAIGPENDVFVTAFSSGVHRFSSDGANEGLFLDPALASLQGLAPTDGIFGRIPHAPNQDFYVADYFPNNRVLRANRNTGAASTFVVSGTGGLQQPNSLAFYDDDLFVTSVTSNQVLRFDGASGGFVSVFVPTFPSGLDRPRGLVFHQDVLYLANEGSDSVLKYDAATGAFQGTFVASGAGGLDRPSDLVFGPDGNLYVISRGTRSILRYDGDSGAFIDVFVAGGDTFLENPSCLEWRSGTGDGPTVNISGLTLRNGRTTLTGGPTAGLDIDHGASVSLSASAVRDNSSSVFGGGIQNWGSLTLTEVEVRDNELPEGGGGQTSQGGGIFNTGNLTIRRSLIAGNFATRGGGISNTNQGRVDITNSTISGNRALGAGGGIRNVADGIVNISSSTIAENRANEPAPSASSEADRFGGGIYNGDESRVNMANTILAGNQDNRSSFQEGYSPDCYSATPFRFTSHRDNLVGILTSNCVLRDTIFGDTRFDEVGTAASPLDPRLLPLAASGDSLAVHRLHSDSPALDADTSVTSATFFDCPTTDQRGVTRPQGADCDVGAFELVQGIGEAAPGATSLVGAAPQVAGEAGVLAALTNNTTGSATVSMTYVVFANNPSATPLRSGHFVALDLRAADASDVLSMTFYYPSTIGEADESAPGFRLLYLAGSEWLPVRGSGGALPARDSADNADGSRSGGRFQLSFDASSTPTIGELRETVLAAALAAPESVYLPLVARAEN
jgi:CSLREA domain-containing protein